MDTNKGMLGSKKGAAGNIVGILVAVVFATALIPVIKTFISSATNLTATETVLLGLVTLFVVLGLIYGVLKSTGLTSKM